MVSSARKLADMLANADYSPGVITMVYCLAKIVTLGIVWISGFVAERDMNEAFTREVYLKRKAAPKLDRMVGTLVTTFLVSTLALIALFLLIMFLASNTTLEMGVVTIKLLFDACVSVLVMVLVGSAVASTVQHHTYFNYRTEGLRAIRAVRHILTGGLLVVSLFPFATALPSSKIASTIVKIASWGGTRRLHPKTDQVAKKNVA